MLFVNFLSAQTKDQLLGTWKLVKTDLSPPGYYDTINSTLNFTRKRFEMDLFSYSEMHATGKWRLKKDRLILSKIAIYDSDSSREYIYDGSKCFSLLKFDLTQLEFRDTLHGEFFSNEIIQYKKIATMPYVDWKKLERSKKNREHLLMKLETKRRDSALHMSLVIRDPMERP